MPGRKQVLRRRRRRAVGRGRHRYRAYLGRRWYHEGRAYLFSKSDLCFSLDDATGRSVVRRGTCSRASGWMVELWCA